MGHKIGAIIAITDDGVLGNGLELPWPVGAIKGDLPHFKKVTDGAVVVMGGKTHRGIGRALPNRINVVVSQTIEETDQVRVYPSLALALGFALTMDKPIWIIGGAQILKQAIKLRVLDRIWITRIHHQYSGDIVLDWNADFLSDEGFILTSQIDSEDQSSTIEYWGSVLG